MLARLKAFLNPPNPNPPRAPARIFWTGFLIRVLYMTLAHTYRFRVLDNHFEFGWEMAASPARWPPATASPIPSTATAARQRGRRRFIR